MPFSFIFPIFLFFFYFFFWPESFSSTWFCQYFPFYRKRHQSKHNSNVNNTHKFIRMKWMNAWSTEWRRANMDDACHHQCGEQWLKNWKYFLIEWIQNINRTIALWCFLFYQKMCILLKKNAILCLFLKNISPAAYMGICFIPNNSYLSMVEGIAFVLCINRVWS